MSGRLPTTCVISYPTVAGGADRRTTPSGRDGSVALVRRLEGFPVVGPSTGGRKVRTLTQVLQPRKAVDHNLRCIEVMNETGSRDLKIWLADGTNYPGQGDMRARQDRLAEGLAEIYAQIGDDQRLVLEYKFFEPAFYHTDVPDWGTSYAHVAALGERAVVCLDTGHHAPGHEHRVHRRAAAAAREARLVRLQQPLLRRRRPDRRRGRPLPAVPDPRRGRARRRLRAGQRRGADARPVPQRREEDPRPDPLGAQRPGDDRPGAAAGHRGARRGPRRRATCSRPTRSSWTRSTPTYAPTWRPGARSAGCPPTRCGPTSHSGYQEQIEADRVGGAQAGWN